MSKLAGWSTTAGDNDMAVPEGAPEGMAPSQVNDVIRQVMKRLREWYVDSEWIERGDTIVSASGANIVLSGDVSDVYAVGRSVRADGTVGTVTAVAFSTNTTVTVSGITFAGAPTTWEIGILNTSQPNGGGGSIAQVIGGVGKNNASTPNSKIDFTSADAVVFYSPTAAAVTQRSLGSLTNDTGASGPAANGRDQSSAFSNSSWVHFYYIYGAGQTTATISSASASAPTLPSGYTHYAFICSVRKQSSGNFLKVRIYGDLVFYEAGADGPYENQVLTSGSATSATSVSVAAAVPTTAKSFGLYYDFAGRASNADAFALRIASTADVFFLGVTHNTAAAPVIRGATQEVPNLQSLYYSVGNASDGLDLIVTGYRVKNGG